MAIDGGPGVWSFSGATSFYVECDGQEEVDHLWEKLSAVPEAEQCGWIKDKFGLTWQIIPRQLPEMLMDQDREKAGRAMAAMMQMKKIDVAKLKEAFEGK
jgi:predicted 3-demethylubiquinone-9 3-methyltransferase (glyoxalase superfamily)